MLSAKKTLMIVSHLKPFWKPSGFLVLTSCLVEVRSRQKRQGESHADDSRLFRYTALHRVTPRYTALHQPSKIFPCRKAGTKVENQNTKISKSLTIWPKTHFLRKTLPFPRSEQKQTTVRANPIGPSLTPRYTNPPKFSHARRSEPKLKIKTQKSQKVWRFSKNATR